MRIRQGCDVYRHSELILGQAAGRRKGKESVERAYAITSLRPESADAARLLKIWRVHWGIENKLHWVRDVVFGEGRSQVRTGAAPQLLAALRNSVIGLLRLGGVKNISAALRHCGRKPWETLGYPDANRPTLPQLKDPEVRPGGATIIYTVPTPEDSP